VLQAIFTLVSRDEAAHAAFYRAMVRIELDADRAATIADLALVIAQFQIPGKGLIPEYRELSLLKTPKVAKSLEFRDHPL
jgi:acyl-[acyl-carrier-protein] desaturase